MIRGTVVLSLSGRDEGRIFAVIDIIDENYILIADGKHRKLDKPKKKKLKHLKIFDDKIDITDITNRKLNEYINEIRRDYSAKR